MDFLRGKKRIFGQMFDVRPVKETGDIDVDKILKVMSIASLKDIRTQREDRERKRALKIPLRGLDRGEKIKELKVKQRGRDLFDLDAEIKFGELAEEIRVELARMEYKEPAREEILAGVEGDMAVKEKKEDSEEIGRIVSSKTIREVPRIRPVPLKMRGVVKWQSVLGFAIAGILVFSLILSFSWLGRGTETETKIWNKDLESYQNLLAFQKPSTDINFLQAQIGFGTHEKFFETNNEIEKISKTILSILEGLSGKSVTSWGRYLLSVGENIAKAGSENSSAIRVLNQMNFSNIFKDDQSFPTDSISQAINLLSSAKDFLERGQGDLGQIRIGSLPEDIQREIIELKEKIPSILGGISEIIDEGRAFLGLLGHDSPRKYLLLFQNSAEMRATGGFIGNYGILDIDKGKIKEIFVDDILNLDGQLQVKIIPPQPLQRVSTVWSTHDANWFADFPTSAQKVAWFYEQASGLNVDGVIAFTPTVMERLLEIIGPIEMPDYGVVINGENFVETIQYQIEAARDKKLSQPKKILVDLVPLIIQRISQTPDFWQKMSTVFKELLQEKHILIFSFDKETEDFILNQGWAGEIIDTDGDYLSVVHSNIGGYKTDWVIEEEITHNAEIQDDGSIIDTLSINRRHREGKYDWWNRTNIDYLRIYVPLGSRLISVKGQASEPYFSSIDYSKYDFEKDVLVSEIESTMVTDKKTGTDIFKESGKTVFGNWVYTKPGQSTIIIYKYRLPFKIDISQGSDSYSLYVQKQAGGRGIEFSTNLKIPEKWGIIKKEPEELQFENYNLKLVTDLDADKVVKVVFEQR